VVAATAVPITISGGQIGVLQGERRWWPVAVLYLASGVPRLVLGTALILWRPTELAAIAGVFLGAVVPVVIGAVILRRTREAGRVSETHATAPIVREIISNSQALLAFLSLSVCDVILARNILDEHDAGLYAGGLILTKAMLFLPQFVVVVAFPSMATAHERRRALLRSLALVSGLGSVGILICALVPQLALVFVGGDDYAEIEDRLWMFALLGTVLSLIQLLVYAVLARRGTRSVYIIWAAVAVLVVVGLQLSSLESLLLTVATVDFALFATLLVISLRRLEDPLVVEVPLAEPTV
jgi:O-antigen/teichoic acid export membrane protein